MPAKSVIARIATITAVLLLPTAAVAQADAPSLSLSVPSIMGSGHALSFGANSAYDGPNGTHSMTVFAIPPSIKACPATPTPPAASKIVLHAEEVDNHFELNGLTPKLNKPGVWTICAYLTDASGVTAAKSAPVTVKGANGTAQHKSHRH